MIRVAYSPIYKFELPPGHRFPMEKYELLPEQLLYEGLLSKDNFFHPPPLDDALILLTHTEDYLAMLHNLPLERKVERNIGFPVNDQLIFRGKHIANGTLMCAYFALESGVALNIAGGTHHAYADKGEGFCVFNDFAIASNILLERKDVNKILIVDLDVHQGNGTAKIFEDNPKVFTFSMHGDRNYPLRKEKSDLDIALPDGCQDEEYLGKLRQTLPKLIEQEKPDLIFYLSGVDVLEIDKLGRLSLSIAGAKERDEFVFEQAQKYEIPVAVSMGGGYASKIGDIIEAHANTYRAAFSYFGE